MNPETDRGPTGDAEQTITVLHVDDEPELPETVAAHLEKHDDRFAVLTASGPEEGLERLGPDVDCVVADYDMPGADGLSFLDDVRDRRPGVPFILFTGKGSEDVASEAITSGVTDYIQKGHGPDRYALLANRIAHAVEAHRNELAVERSERRLRRTYERITDGLFTVDNDWRYTFVNSEGAEFVGEDPDAMIGERVWDVFPGLEDSDFGDALRTAMETKETVSIEAEYDPHDTWYDVRVYPDEEGISIFFRDVSDRKRREQELAETNALLQGVLETTPAAVFVKDLEGRYQLMNDECRALFGLDPEDVEGMTDEELFPDEVAERFRADDRRVIEEGETIEIEEQVPTDDGTRTFLTLKSPLEGEGGEHNGVCSVAIDITERVAYEREVERKDERLDEFASVVSHDLRNPLQVFEGSLDLAESGDEDAFERARRAVDRMERLIDDLLTLAEEGRTVGERSTVDLDDLAERCWTTVDTADADLVVDADLTLRADEGRLAEMLENLFDNAVTHGGEDVTVTVTGLEDAEGFAVEDDGPGIPDGERGRVFDSGYTTEQDGTGMGLAIVDRVADAHGWRAVASEEGDGARFEIRGVDAT